MTVTPQTEFRETGNTDRASFRAALARTVAAGVTPPPLREADQIYEALAPRGLTRLAAGMAWIERRNETDPGGLAFYPRHFHNLWATKNPNGSWTRFDSYAEAARHWGPYVLGETYADLMTIAQFINRYAPDFENDTNRYIRQLVDEINTLPLLDDGEPPVDTLPYRVSLIPAGNRNRPRTAINAGGPRYVTVHETGNTSTGTDAEVHRRFTHEGGGPENVSFHLVVDDHEAIQLLPFTEIGFHAGDGCNSRANDLGCFDSVAIETCVNRDGDWERTFGNLSTLIANLIRETPTLGADRIRQHNAWSGKNCPQRIRETGRWDELLTDVRGKLGGTAPPLPGPPPDEWDWLPPWLTPEHLRLAFPDASATGPLTRALVAWADGDLDLPIFRERRQDGTRSLWVFDRVTFLSDGGHAWLPGEETI